MKSLFALLALAVTPSALLSAQAPAPEPPAKAPDKAAEKPKTAKDRAKDVTPDEAEKLIASKAGLIILDVRTPEEFDHEHIKDALNVNLFDADFEAKLAALDQTKPVLVHCQGGTRSTRALKEATMNFPEIYHLRTGIKGWIEAKKPLETKPLPGEGRLGPGKKN
jgi:rhodanese-related sulfurtransferase